MGLRADPRPFLPVALAAGVLACASSAAIGANADYCVTCKNPDQTYRCQIKGAGTRLGDALKLYCVMQTAKEGNHASCSAEKATAACNGLVKVYSFDSDVVPENIASDPRVQKLKQKVERNRRTFEEKPEGDAPKTLFELGGRAMDASRKGLRNAGSAIGVMSSAEQGTTGAVQPPSDAPRLPADDSATANAAEPESEGITQRTIQAAQDAGSAVGSFTRKSYRCVVSLFRNCSGEPE